MRIHLHEARDYSDTETRIVPLDFRATNMDWFWNFDADVDDSKFLLNVSKWVQLTGLYDASIVPSLLMGCSEPLEDFATIEYSYWVSPSQYFEDPGDGGFSIKVINLPTYDELLEYLTAQLDYTDGISEDAKKKLLSVVDTLHKELVSEYDGYVDDSNW